MRPGDINVGLLPLLGAAAYENHEPVAVAPEIQAKPGPKSILYSRTPAPTGLTFERLPPAIRSRAVVTFTAATITF